MRRFRIVDMCKGKRKLWLQGTHDVLVVGLHMVGKRVKVSSLNNVTSLLTLCFSFLSLDPSLSYLYCYLIFLFFFFFFHSHIFFFHIFFFFLSFFSILILFLFYFLSLDNFSKLSTPLIIACIQSEFLNKSCLRQDETFEIRLRSRNAMYKRDV
jgi:hypothetical protein